MTIITSVTAVIGCSYRLLCFIFLRVIPTRLAQPLLPLLFSLHALGLAIYVRTVQACDQCATETKVGFNEKTPSPPRARKRYRDLLDTLICLPSISKRVNLTNIVINIGLLIAAAEFAFTPFFDNASDVVFTRVGAVYPDGAKVVVRYPLPPSQNASVSILWREAARRSTNDTRWQQGPAVNLTQDLDWVSTAKIEGLWPQTSYEYILAGNDQTPLPYPPYPIQFTTFPDPRLDTGTDFHFVVSSCITPNFPYRGPSYRNAIHGFDLLASKIAPSHSTLHTPANDSETLHTPAVDFLLFLGDFIYADVPVYIGDEKEAYRRLYRRNYQSPSFRKIYEHIPIFHTYDDHEIINNYIGEDNDSKIPFPNAADAFKIYTADANYDSVHNGQFYYQFQRGDAAFFVMDTRRYRSGMEDSNFSTRSMLGELQLSALLFWLSEVNSTATFKFVVSSVPFTTLWSHDAQFDSWAGFPSERRLLLDTFHSVPNVFILSGDRHEFAAIQFNGEDVKSHPVYEFSTSPLSMFYIPFVRTLAPRSKENVTRMRVEKLQTENGTELVGFTQEVPAEDVLKYLPIGNYKWSDIRVDTTNASKPLLYLETFIDGASAYNFTIEGSPLEKDLPVAIGASVTDSLREIFHKIGLTTNRWL
ncbi:hypothetical protein D9756_001793 [Leucocoprinus leucothites]|uniref:PhoD-like phosphatase metallophosphatase domain-containing protein n=1 Tax=Leucocoprinus leucothites TaxID=201217 RepID=A0A8H5LI65_9AGAR|nr:hypothetical protein D9756_001793 [Leucoagaricus leucothites]